MKLGITDHILYEVYVKLLEKQIETQKPCWQSPGAKEYRTFGSNEMS